MTMKRNIVTTIEFANGSIAVNVIEKLSTNEVEIFTNRGTISKAHAFLKESLQEIATKLGGQVSEVVVVVEPLQSIDTRIDLVKESIRIVGESVHRKDIDNILNLTKSKHKQTNREIILAQPLQFEVKTADESKRYLKAPIYKTGETLFATIAITSISSEAHDFINSLVKAHGLEITQILLKPQTISQTILSETALVSGAVLIHVGYHQAFITINRNNGTIATMSFYDGGLKQLLIGISKMFSCTVNEARELVSIYGSLTAESNRVIYTRQDGVKEITHTSEELKQIIQQYTRRLLTLANKFMEQKMIIDLPIILSGEFSQISGLEEYAKGILNRTIAKYQPTSYMEMNYAHHNCLGVMNLNRRLDGVLGKQLNTIVETNPNTFSTLHKKPKKLFARIMEKIGGNYDYN